MNDEFQGGVWPVMVTPFTDNGEIDESALRELVDWYIEHGVNGLFATCQSSEIFKLSLEERIRITEITLDAAAGRVKVIASGHVSDSIEDQIAEINAIGATGVDAVILITNRLAKEDESDDIWIANMRTIIKNINPEIKLGAYECPYPYKRLLSLPVIKECADTGRFYFLKDTCCNADQIRKKLDTIKNSKLKLYNANATLLLESLRDGAAGYSGIMANFHPELYVWLCANYNNPKADDVQEVLMVSSLIERQLYPVNAKYHLMEIEKLAMGYHSRVQDKNLLTETFKKEVHMMDRLCNRTFNTYCK